MLETKKEISWKILILVFSVISFSNMLGKNHKKTTYVNNEIDGFYFT